MFDASAVVRLGRIKDGKRSEDIKWSIEPGWSLVTVRDAEQGMKGTRKEYPGFNVDCLKMACRGHFSCLRFGPR